MKLNNYLIVLINLIALSNNFAFGNDTLVFKSEEYYYDSLYTGYLKLSYEQRKLSVKSMFNDTSIYCYLYDSEKRIIKYKQQYPNKYTDFIGDVYSLANKKVNIESEWSDYWILKIDTVSLNKHLDSLSIDYKNQDLKATKYANIPELFLDIYFMNNIEGRIELYEKYYKKLDDTIRSYIILDLNTLLEFNNTINFERKKKETKYLVKSWQQKLKLLQQKFSSLTGV